MASKKNNKTCPIDREQTYGNTYNSSVKEFILEFKKLCKENYKQYKKQRDIQHIQCIKSFLQIGKGLSTIRDDNLNNFNEVPQSSFTATRQVNTYDISSQAPENQHQTLNNQRRAQQDFEVEINICLTVVLGVIFYSCIGYFFYNAYA